MILIAGATGHLGSEIARRLRAKGQDVRALVRTTSDPEKISQLQQLGAETVTGNLQDRASLDAACKGVRTVISTVTTIVTAQPGDSFVDTDAAGTISLIDAAAAAGAEHFIFISVDTSQFPDTPLTNAKRAVETHLKSRELSYTILQPALFMEVWLGPMLFGDPSTGQVKIYGEGHGHVAYVALGDVAEVAVRAVSLASARNSTIKFGGPDAVTQRDVVKIFEETGAKPLAVTEVPEQALEAQWMSASDPHQRTFSGLMLGLARLDEEVVPLQPDLEFDRTSVTDYAKRLSV